MEDKRFQGKAGEEYELFKLASPNCAEAENTLGPIIKEWFQDKEVKEIKVIEIGCGTGYTTGVVLKSDDRTKVVAIDNEPIMIKQSKENLKKFIDDNRVKLVEADALEYLKNQSSASFDVFASGFTIHNFSKECKEQVIKEVYRILKPQGIFLNVDKYAVDDEEKHKQSLNWELQQFREKYEQINRPDLIQEWTSHYLKDDAPELRMKEGESLKLMSTVGFKNPKIVFRKHLKATLFARK